MSADTERTLDFVPGAPTAKKPLIESLLPPGADLLPPGAEESAAPPPVASPPPPVPIAPAPIVAMYDQPRAGDLTPEEKAQRRLIKHAVLFGFSIVVLTIVFYLLAR